MSAALTAFILILASFAMFLGAFGAVSLANDKARDNDAVEAGKLSVAAILLWALSAASAFCAGLQF